MGEDSALLTTEPLLERGVVAQFFEQYNSSVETADWLLWTRGLGMRNLSIVLFLGLSLALGFGQQTGGNPITVSGCLMSVNGGFSLSTHNGDRYVLKGDHNTMFGYNGKLVQVTGTVKSPKKSSSDAKPVTLRVTEIKKVADFCQ